MARAVRSWVADADLEAANTVLDHRFSFLGEERRLPGIDWDRRYGTRLWSYHLHYFDFAVELAEAFAATGDARYARAFQSLADGWMRGASPHLSDGWDPYPTSLRTVNWIHAALLFGEALEGPFVARLLADVHRQLAWLEHRIEYHLMANHLLKNLKALAIGGWIFEDRRAERWRTRMRPRLWRQVAEQVLVDGVHFERSPMYHSMALLDVLEVLALARAAGDPVPDDVERRTAAMVDAFGWLSRPDGALHLFHDSAQDHGPSRARIDRMSRIVLGRGVPSPDGLVELPAGGYFGFVEAGSGVRLLIDAGEPGAPYQPGHAHCSLLSYELDWFGLPLVVDSGVSGYEGDPLREYVRSTRAHNTVVIGGKEQSETWATFRMGRRARVELARQWREGEGFRFEGAYRPFHDRRIRHTRRVAWMGAGTLEVQDRVEGAPGEALESYLHFHPSWSVRPVDEGFLIHNGDRALILEPLGFDRGDSAMGAHDPPQGWYCPRFGERLPAAAAIFRLPRNEGSWVGYRLRRRG